MKTIGEGRVRNLFLILADALSVGLVWLFVVLGYHAMGGGYSPSFYLQMWPVIPVFIGVNVLFRLYHGRVFYPSAPFSPVEEMRRLVCSALLVHVGVIALLALMRQTTEGYSRVVIVMSGILTAALVQPVRDVVRAGLKRFSIGQQRVVLVGDGLKLQRIAAMLRTDAHLGFMPIGYFGSSRGSSDILPRLGGFREVVKKARRLDVHTLLVHEDIRIFRSQLRAFSGWFTHILYLPPDAAFPVSGSRTVSLDGIGGVELVNQGRMSVLRLEKWFLDKILASVAFVLLSPFIVIISALVKITSPGKIFFRHERLGLHGNPIRIWKFRTMYADADARLKKILADDPEAAAEWAKSFKLKDDPRVTPLGRLLRKTSLDEIPQIFNVLGGSMALVGPRPIIKAEKALYGASYEVFSSVKPGMTGLWQVSGRSDTDYSRRIALDTQYAQNWSPWMDIWIIIRTAWTVVLMRGAC